MHSQWMWRFRILITTFRRYVPEDSKALAKYEGEWMIL